MGISEFAQPTFNNPSMLLAGSFDCLLESHCYSHITFAYLGLQASCKCSTYGCLIRYIGWLGLDLGSSPWEQLEQYGATSQIKESTQPMFMYLIVHVVLFLFRRHGMRAL